MTEPLPAAPMRRRPFLALPSWVLAICLVLPTVRVCGTPAMPLEFPPSYAVYLGAILIGLIAASRRVRLRQIAMVMVVTLWITTAATLVAITLGAYVFGLGVGAGLAGLFGIVVAVRAMLRAAPSDRAITIVCVVHALIATGWNALLAFDPESMWGAYVAFAASLAMVAAGTATLVTDAVVVVQRRRASRPVPLPLARIYIE